ncbi:hypothetical protein [Rhizobium giardinii]|uniref:Uncharacterized protein n=1 Tax=Rhizobium giardinii TaxID=56731 RepID=A0A7W8X985_9HYPH|nr:hypothetical protein [Rhizobium giardinii]MBB5536391.1 hypothetical protein [Rhizobium giardinii]
MDANETPAVLPAGTRAQEQRKLMVGRAAMVIVSGFAVAAFTIYAIVMLYAITIAN